MLLKILLIYYKNLLVSLLLLHLPSQKTGRCADKNPFLIPQDRFLIFSKKDHGEYTQKDRNWKKVIPVSLEQYTYGGNYEQKILNDSTVVPLEERILEQLGLEHDLVKLKKVMKKLKPYEREIIYQLFWMNKSQNDLAMKYSVTRQTMHEKVHRILVKVLKLFENEK